MLMSENGPDASKWHICFASTLDGSHNGASALATPGQANMAPEATATATAVIHRDLVERPPRPMDGRRTTFSAMTIGISESLNGPLVRLLASRRSSQRGDQDLIVVLLATQPVTLPGPAVVRQQSVAMPGLGRSLSYWA